MPIVHGAPGSGKGGQFISGGGGSSAPPPAAQRYLAASHKAIVADQAKGTPKLTGSKKQVAAETKYLKALHRANHAKVTLNARTVKKVTATQKATAKKAAAAQLKAKRLAAKNAALAARPVRGKVAKSKNRVYKPGARPILKVIKK